MRAVIFGIWLFFVVGWVINLIDFVNLDFEAPYKAEVIRGVGIFVAPVGGILGYVPMDEEKE